jgi:hypothetical protein
MMSATAYADPVSLFGRPVPKLGAPPLRRSLFGNIALIAFLVAQCLDGIFTYVGVSTFGVGIEANPIVAGLMVHLGHEAGLFGAKAMAGMLGVCLHLREIHRAVALLAAFYFAVAVGPWALILFL